MGGTGSKPRVVVCLATGAALLAGCSLDEPERAGVDQAELPPGAGEKPAEAVAEPPAASPPDRPTRARLTTVAPPPRTAAPVPPSRSTICPDGGICAPGQLRCGGAEGGGRSTTLERCRADCSGFDLIRRCLDPDPPGFVPDGPDWPEVCGPRPESGGLDCLSCACVPGETRCVADEPGGSAGSLRTCDDKCVGWRVVGPCGCSPSSEVCNGVDDDCDGEVDEEPEDAGGGCDTGRPGWCAEGLIECVAGALACVPARPLVDDTCNGEDEDCDWQADEHWTPGDRSCGVGACVRPPRCEGGVELCEPGPPQAEECNGLDDDCDGEVDEAFAVIEPAPIDVLPVRLLLLLDMSGSMELERYDHAEAAIVEVLRRLRGRLLFGFDAFPVLRHGDACAVDGPAIIDCGLGTELAIERWLARNAPDHDAWTPLVAKLDGLLDDPDYAPGCLSDRPPGETYLVVISDGGDSCDGCAPGCARHLAAITDRLRRAGLRTVAMGYAGSADGPSMDAIARAGGTAFDQYIEAPDRAGLVDALSTIAGEVAGCELDAGAPEAAAQPGLVNLYVDGELAPYDAACAVEDGWRWVDADRGRLELCPGVCARARTGLVEVRLRIGCPTVEAL